MYDELNSFILRTYGIAVFVILIFIILLWRINLYQQKRARKARRERQRNLRYAVRWEAYDRAVAEIQEREQRSKDNRIFDTVRDFHATPE